MQVRGLISARRLLVVTGKGGVGKSVVVAALGHLMSESGRHVLLLELDARESLHRFLGTPPSGGDFVRVSPFLHLQSLETRAVLAEIVRDRLRVPLLTRRVLASPLYEHFTETAPGLQELAALGHAHRLLEQGAPRSHGIPKPDLVIIDAPASGHALSLLSAPSLVAETLRSGPFGRMAAELAGFVSDRGACGVIVVCRAEGMPVQETIELLDGLETRLGRTPELLVINALYPPFDPSDPHLPPESPALVLWRRRAEINDEQRERLLAHHRGARAELPLLPLPAGPRLVQSLVRKLSRELSAPAEAS